MRAEGRRKFVSLAAVGLTIACAGCNRKAKGPSESESALKNGSDTEQRWFGAGNVNACNYITREDAEEYFAKDAKIIWHPFFNECYLVEASTPESDTYRPSPDHPFIALRSYTREQWDKDKDPNPSSDRALDSLGDEAIDHGGPGGIFFRKGDNCFDIYGFSHTDHTLNELAERVLSRIQ